MLHMANPPHPGKILKEDFISELNITITETAKKLNVTRKTISDIVNQKSGISPEMSIKLSKAFGTDEDYWYMLQVLFDMANARKNVNLNDVEVIHKAS